MIPSKLSISLAVSLCESPENVWKAFSMPAKRLLLNTDSVVVLVDGVPLLDDTIEPIKPSIVVDAIPAGSSVAVVSQWLADGDGVVVVVAVVPKVVVAAVVVVEINFFNFLIRVVVSNVVVVDGVLTPPAALVARVLVTGEKVGLLARCGATVEMALTTLRTVDCASLPRTLLDGTYS